MGVLGFFKDKIGETLKDKNARIIVAVIAFLLLYRYFKGKENKNDLLAEEPSTTGAKDLAIKLYQALHLYFDGDFGFFDVPDGTDKNAIAQLAINIGRLNNYQAVAAAYKTLYNKNLIDELNANDVADIFETNLQAGKASNGGTGNLGSNTTGTKNGSVVVRTGDIITLKKGWNIRGGGFSDAVYKKSVGGEQYKVKEIWTNKTVAGIKGTWLYVTPLEIWNLTYFYVSIDAVGKSVKPV